MEVRPAVVVREQKPPFLAVIAPALYLLACALCIRAVMMDRSMEIGISGLLVAVGLAPAFALPAVFSTRRALLQAVAEGLLVDGRLVKVNDLRLARADRGTALLTLETRQGDVRHFVVPSYATAQSIAASLPPASGPALSADAALA